MRQMKQVLRMRTGDTFMGLDNLGHEFLCVVEDIKLDEIHAKILKKEMNKNEPDISLTLFQAMPKKMELFEWVLQKGTELGVSEFVPLITKHTERDELTKRDRLERILKEAAEQSERGKIPTLSEPLKLSALRTAYPSLPLILFHGRGDFPPLSSQLSQIKTWPKCGLVIGPEGGFSEEEVALAQQQEFFILSLGSRVLRTETAGIATAACIIHS